MRVNSATFLCAAEDKKHYPKTSFKEIAFAGRSNVGKSSMINSLLGRHRLVRTSKTPGHTRKLNFFLIDDRLVFVDLPGYGFAAVPLEVRRKWQPMVETYLKEREQLKGVVVIVDSRMPPTESDLSLIAFLQANGIPLVVVATKADKIGRAQAATMERSTRALVGDHVPVVIFSAHDGQGKNELWKQIKSLID